MVILLAKVICGDLLEQSTFAASGQDRDCKKWGRICGNESPPLSLWKSLPRVRAFYDFCSMAHSHDPHPPGHVVGPALWISALGVVLAGGLYLLGFLRVVDQSVSSWVQSWGLGESWKPAPAWLPWIVAVLWAVGAAFTLLDTPGQWRRILLALTAGILLFAWVPVCSLAGWMFPLAMPLLAAVWSSVCALVYVSRHRMPCDKV